MTQITREHVLKLAKLSKLALTDEEVAQFQSELSAILAYVERLESVDVTGFEPTYQVSGLVNQFRKDVIIDTSRFGYTHQDLLSCVPVRKDDYIQVGRMI